MADLADLIRDGALYDQFRKPLALRFLYLFAVVHAFDEQFLFERHDDRRTDHGPRQRSAPHFVERRYVLYAFLLQLPFELQFIFRILLHITPRNFRILRAIPR